MPRLTPGVGERGIRGRGYWGGLHRSPSIPFYADSALSADPTVVFPAVIFEIEACNPSGRISGCLFLPR